ncbi:NUDIX hydrolase [Acidihalobacter aeolianus]|uniref:Phosphatase NudJ n=1 Tax=Acidihalobacter aeolianus TaxID=2792603 RepID=A0A1D8K7L5_9GAMM|nr:NUDIX hydrolase [Acidihalobacter aeolianus]AOV16953.1 NUDIX hydrolase [Acidihalobacter aeolianus]
MRFQPHVTVAAVIEREGRFLLVRERIDGHVKYNQPAGHLEDGESLVEAVIRETLEETARHFTPIALVGIYRWVNPVGETFLRVAFSGTAGERDVSRALDDGIEDTEWLSPDALRTLGERLRSPLVLRAVADHGAGHRYPLALLRELD